MAISQQISLNATKTELIFSRKPSEKIPDNIIIKLNGKKLDHTSHIKYLGGYLDEFLDGSAHCHELHVKLRRSIGILDKTKNYINQNELISLYHATFSSLLLYGCQVWSTND